MEESNYKAELRKVLNEHSEIAIMRLNSVLENLPEKSESIELVIFPDQDGEGAFDVRVSLTGPDLYVINKEIENKADIFTVKHTEYGFEPDVPMMDPFDSDFEVNDVLSNVVGEWLQLIWNQVNFDSINLPVTIFADEGYGDKLPIKLN